MVALRWSPVSEDPPAFQLLFGENGTIQPLAIHHVSLNVSDVPAAVSFYTETLGGALRDDRPDLGISGAWIDFGAQQLHLLQAPVPASLGQHFAIQVRDLQATVDELRAVGFEVDDPSSIGPNRQTFVSDPAGNIVELHEVGTSSR